ncbi:MAG: hypothetical protein FWG74_03985 [Planctomycetes bacterium]|nr:hypothetical protein [Planctomycetota bacterium]
MSSNVGSPTVKASGGLFTVTDAQGNTTKVDLGTLMMMLNLERTENLDNQLAVQMQEIMDRNTQIQMLTELMMWARNQKAAGKDDGSPTDYTTVDANGKPIGTHSTGQGKGVVTINGETRTVQGPNGWAEYLGIEWVDCYGNRPTDKDKAATWDAAWDTNIQNMKSKLDMLNNDSQVANIELQNLLEKRGNAFEMTTKVMDTNNQSVQSILRNL